jgi:hypothetical protein
MAISRAKAGVSAVEGFGVMAGICSQGIAGYSCYILGGTILMK